MKLSRRDFIHAGCAIAAATLVPHPVEAWIHGSNPFLNPLLSQRNIINMGPPSDFTYGFINHVTPADAAVGPVGTNYTVTANTWMQLIDQNGYPNNSNGSGNWGMGVRFPSTSNFAGPYVITWDGDGRMSLSAGTWTEASTTTTAVGNANGTTTLSGFSSVVGIAPSFGISGTGVTGGTTVVSVNYSTKTVVVSATVTTGSGITFTFTNSTYTKNSNGNWTNTTGVKPYILVSNSGLANNTLMSFNNASTGSAAVAVTSMSWSGGLVTVTTTSPHARPLGSSLTLTFFGATPSSINSTFLCTVTGASTYTFALTNNPGPITGTITYIAFLTNLRIYRQADEVDGAPVSQGGNGYTFRAPFKQPFVNLNPGAIRFLNWVSVANNVNNRFEGRSLPTKAGLATNWVSGPAYGDTAGTNQITLAAATGTAGNSQATPASMVHGEIVMCRMANALVRNSKVNITAITKFNPGQVTAAAHGFSTGDQILLRCGTDSVASGNPYVGMVELNYVPVTITVVDANNFTIGIDTTTFTAFAVGTKGVAQACQFVTLQVGSGNDRTAYPVVFRDTSPTGAQASPWSATDYQTFVFDKNQAGQRTSGTNPQSWTQGVWMQTGQSSPGNPSVHSGMVPLEYVATFISELNTLSQSQGISNPIHLMMSIPTMSLQPVDPDYSTTSDWALNAISVVMGGNLGYPGLQNCPNKPSVILEFSNETWNFGQSQTSYLAALNFVRNGSATTDNTTMAALRSTLMARNVTANSPYASRVKLTLGMQGIAGSGAPNNARASGAGTNYFADAWNTWQGGLTPISFHDCCNWGSYFDPTNTYCNTTTGTGTFTDDSAMYNGTDNSGTLSMTGGTAAGVSATLTASNASISGTNTFSAGNSIAFGTTVGNISAGTIYTISATGLSGSAFQILDGGGNLVTPNTNGSATATLASTTLTITAVGAGTPIINQPLVGPGIRAPSTFITNVSGSAPNYTLTLNQSAGVANGATITAPANSGGNYVGAANPSQAIANFVANIQSAPGGSSQTIGNFCAHASPTAGIAAQFNTLMAGYGKRSIGYEGGTDWQCNSGGTVGSTHTITTNDSLFLNAVNASSQWSTAQIQFFNDVGTLSVSGLMPLYQYQSGNAANLRWGYFAPDTYSGGVEGAALANSPVWAGMGTRNQGLS